MVLVKPGQLIALDISNAFDEVWHAGLLHKLRSYGVSGPIFEIIRSFLDGRKMKVILHGQSSISFTIYAGVFQSSVPGSTLFLIFINDLPDDILSKTGIYADDTTIYSTLSSKAGFFAQFELADSRA